MNKRNKIGVGASIIGAVINALLGGLKFFIGLATNSVSILTDGINNLGDFLSNIGGAVGIGVSSTAPTKKHPHGFEKSEDIATLFVASILFIVGIIFVYNSADRLVYRRPVYFSWLYFGLVIGTMVVKVAMGIGYKLANKKVNSTILDCVKIDSYLDVGITSVALIGYTVSQFTGFPLDAIVGIVIGVIVAINGFKLLKGAVSKLIGEDNQGIRNSVFKMLQVVPEITKIEKIVVFDNGKSSSIVAKIEAQFESMEEVENLKSEIKEKTNYIVYFEGKIVK
ncbi:MAG: cation diffusion facilitator family transporter [Clostridia bacterium]